ncbi:glutamate synthase-related protein [Micromonospora haikouensis]|uniref:glutamate synthase-related protein n=1 Tax=Micromonospora haikouensis TaxID=686309 RepID=UPI00210A1A89|nr:glutamate synthase-related protein [Micromonospora haikouensis]
MGPPSRTRRHRRRRGPRRPRRPATRPRPAAQLPRARAGPLPAGVARPRAAAVHRGRQQRGAAVHPRPAALGVRVGEAGEQLLRVRHGQRHRVHGRLSDHQAPHHRRGGELVFQLGTAYFGCRDERGRFDLARLKDLVAGAPVRALEVKLSQGAKPSLGGLLPGAKVSAEIAATRGVPQGRDCVSPSRHAEFADKVFAERGLHEQVVFVGAGKLGLPDNAVVAFALGCDMVNVGREAMLAIGCIQAQKCHTDTCPTGVATQHPWLARGLDPARKSVRAANYLRTLRRDLVKVAEACGVEHPGLIDADSVEILDGRTSATPLREVYGYRPDWGLPSAADQAEIVRLMTPQAPRGGTATPSPTAVC